MIVGLICFQNNNYFRLHIFYYRWNCLVQVIYFQKVPVAFFVAPEKKIKNVFVVLSITRIKCRIFYTLSLEEITENGISYTWFVSEPVTHHSQSFWVSNTFLSFGFVETYFTTQESSLLRENK